MTSRRAFLRIAGTSAVVVAASAAGLSQCDPMPEAAVEAWQGPSSHIQDVRLRSLSYALLAPNPHNMQPWIVDLSEANVITFLCDRSRLLPETDPYSRQITIGCGAFLELLRMAAAEQGYRIQFDYFPNGDWPPNAVGDQAVCRASFTLDATLQRDPLFAHVLKRRTTRIAYDDKIVDRQLVTGMGEAMKDLPVTYGWTDDAGRLASLRRIAKRAWDIEMTTDPTYYESVKVYRITGESIAEYRDGLSFHGPLFWWMHRLGLFTREGGLKGDKLMRDQAIALIDGPLASTKMFAWITTDENSRRAQLDAGAAYVRANLHATASGLVMQPLSQALQEFKEMLPVLAEHKRAVGLPDSATVQMFFRVGYAASAEPSPRRRLQDLIRT